MRRNKKTGAVKNIFASAATPSNPNIGSFIEQVKKKYLRLRVKSFIAYTDIFYRVSGGSSQPHKNAATRALSGINVMHSVQRLFASARGK